MKAVCRTNLDLTPADRELLPVLDVLPPVGYRIRVRSRLTLEVVAGTFLCDRKLWDVELHLPRGMYSSIRDWEKHYKEGLRV